MIDVIIVGSGPGGVNAAYPLCEAGLNVVMLDYGNIDDTYRHIIPRKDFDHIRRSDEQQHRYFLGDGYEGILLGDVRVGTKLTPPRLHVVKDSKELTPVDSSDFVANESLAMGGLAESWGAGVLPFREEDFADMPVSYADLEPHYRSVVKRIGVSGPDDDVQSMFGDYGELMPPLDLDSNAEKVLGRYSRRKTYYNDQGFYMGRASLAVCTRPCMGRDAHQYHDMDYWTDTDSSVYRPRYTIDELSGFDNFSYIHNRLVYSFAEKEDGTVEITAGLKDSDKTETYQSRAVILAAGAMGSARIVLRSLRKYDIRIPILTNMYTYIPLINRNMIGVKPRDRRSSLAQLMLLYFSGQSRRRPVVSCFFSYRSLLTFKLLKEGPLPQRESLNIMSSLMNLFGIITIFHRAEPSPSKFCILRRSADGIRDRLEIQYKSSEEEMRMIQRTQKAVRRFYRSLGCWPLKSILRAPGSSIHYSGTLPMTRGEHELSCDAEGRLSGTRAVYVSDGSVISPLPSIFPTFTIMAVADRIGTILARRLSS
jgi:choline dehydrogenase-like flavoprotein